MIAIFAFVAAYKIAITNGKMNFKWNQFCFDFFLNDHTHPCINMCAADCLGRAVILNHQTKLPAWCGVIENEQECDKAYSLKPVSAPKQCRWSSTKNKCETGQYCPTGPFSSIYQTSTLLRLMRLPPKSIRPLPSFHAAIYIYISPEFPC